MEATARSHRTDFLNLITPIISAHLTCRYCYGSVIPFAIVVSIYLYGVLQYVFLTISVTSTSAPDLFHLYDD